MRRNAPGIKNETTTLSKFGKVAKNVLTKQVAEKIQALT